MTQHERGEAPLSCLSRRHVESLACTHWLAGVHQTERQVCPKTKDRCAPKRMAYCAPLMNSSEIQKGDCSPWDGNLLGKVIKCRRLLNGLALTETKSVQEQ